MLKIIIQVSVVFDVFFNSCVWAGGTKVPTNGVNVCRKLTENTTVAWAVAKCCLQFLNVSILQINLFIFCLDNLFDEAKAQKQLLDVEISIRWTQFLKLSPSYMLLCQYLIRLSSGIQIIRIFRFIIFVKCAHSISILRFSRSIRWTQVLRLFW